MADGPDLNRRRLSPVSAASVGTWVFVVPWPDPDDRSGLSRLLADVTPPEATPPRVTYLAAPTNAEQFFSEQPGAAGWAGENVPAEGTVVYLLNHEPRMPEIIVKHEGVFYTGVEDVAAADYYRGMDRVCWHAAISSPPRPS